MKIKVTGIKGVKNGTCLNGPDFCFRVGKTYDTERIPASVLQRNVLDRLEHSRVESPKREVKDHGKREKTRPPSQD